MPGTGRSSNPHGARGGASTGGRTATPLPSASSHAARSSVSSFPSGGNRSAFVSPPPSVGSHTSSVTSTPPARRTPSARGRDGDYHHPPPPMTHHAVMHVDDDESEEDNDYSPGPALGPSGFPTHSPDPANRLHSDEEINELEEREPLIRNSMDSNGPTSSAISPSTGSGDSLRRSLRGPKAKRGCTDFWALVVFAAYWIGMLVLATYAFTRESNVDFAKYIKDGVDFQGHSCGDKQFVYFPDFRANPDFGFCVEACPAHDGDDLTVQLPLATGKVDGNGTRVLEPVTFKTYATHAWTYVCAPANVATEGVMISQLQDTIGRFVGALGDCWDSMLIACSIALGTASLYLIFLRFCGCFTVFLSTIGIESILVYASYRLLQASANPLSYPNDPAMKSSIQITAVVVCCTAVLFCLLAFNMFPRLLLAGTFITHASKALHQLKRLLIVPFISYVMLLLLFWWAILITICIFGAGHTTMRVATVTASSPSSIEIETESFQVDYHLRWFFLYHVWGVYWTGVWILSIGEMITATAVSMWYFAPDDKVSSLKILPSGGGRSPVSYAFRSTFRFHLGTLALSSAVVTPISYVRAFFAYLEDKNEYDSNVVTTMLARCCCCCIWCFNYCLKFISKEASYITSIQGTNFYPSAKLAHTLISSNLLRVGALSQIGHASVLLGKLIVCFTTCFIGWFLVDSVSSPVLPLVAIACFSYGAAHAFMTIYETTINVLLMCFTLDENMHGGRGNTVHAHAALVRSVNDHLRPKWQTSFTMVLSNDNEVNVVQDGELHLLHASTDEDLKAQRHEIHAYNVPVPITAVRTHLQVWEDDCIERLLTRVAGKDIIGDWTKGPLSNGIQVHHAAVEGISWRTLLTTAKLPVNADQAAHVLISANMIPKYDDMIKEVRIVESLSDSTQVRLVSYKAVLITSPRDCCVTTTVRHEDNGRIIIATRSVEHPAGERDGYVRALAYISGYVLTPDPKDPNACDLSLVAHVDLGGNMPAFVVRYLGLSAPIKMVEKIRQVVLEDAQHHHH